jgi:hypothetical protein
MHPCPHRALTLRSLASAAAPAGPLPVHTLMLDANVFSEEVARTAAAAMPALRTLCLEPRRQLGPNLQASRAKALLALLPSANADAAPRPSLTTLDLMDTFSELPLELAQPLAAATQLHTIRLSGLELPAAEAKSVQVLAGCTQLRSLTVGATSGAAARVLLQALTQLTSLSLVTAGRGPWQLPCSVPQLQALTVTSNWGLAAVGLGGLPSLTQLTATQLSRSQPAPPEGFALPPRLRTLRTHFFAHGLLIAGLAVPEGLMWDTDEIHHKIRQGKETERTAVAWASRRAARRSHAEARSGARMGPSRFSVQAWTSRMSASPATCARAQRGSCARCCASRRGTPGAAGWPGPRRPGQRTQAQPASRRLAGVPTLQARRRLTAACARGGAPARAPRGRRRERAAGEPRAAQNAREGVRVLTGLWHPVVNVRRVSSGTN